MADGLSKGLLSIEARSAITFASLKGVSSQMNSESVMETLKFELDEVRYMSVPSTLALA